MYCVLCCVLSFGYLITKNGTSMMCIKGGNNDGVIQLICKVRVLNF